jgi:large subunit ribosomal protein L23
MRYAGDARSRSTKAGIQRGRTDSFKKAIVTLKAGDSIDYYAGL